MLLVRTIIVIGVAIALLPTEEPQQRRLQEAVRGAYTHATTFCDRNAETCRTAGIYWQTFLRKADFGGRLVMDLALGRSGSAQEASKFESSPGDAVQRRQSAPRG